MALGPQLPESLHQSDSRLRDRAVFLGDLGRSGKAHQGGSTREQEPARFGKFLAEEIKDEELEEPGEAAEAGSSESETAEAKEEAKDSQVENRKDAERLSRQGGESQAEKAAGQWRGPHPAMGLAMLSGGVPLLQAQALEHLDHSRKQESMAETSGLDEGPQQVESALLEALRRDGLSRPLGGFQDPRIQSGPPKMGPEWSQQDFPGGRILRWESHPGSRQVLRWSDQECLLETIAAGQRQVLQKRGEQIWSETSAWNPDPEIDWSQGPRPW